MTTEGHIAALERKHQELDREIQSEMQSRAYDELHITELKRKKLLVKDELTRMKGTVTH